MHPCGCVIGRLCVDASVHAPASYSRTVSIESGFKKTYVDVVSQIRLPDPVSVLACRQA